MAEEKELEEVYRSVTKLEDAHRKMSSQFNINKGFASEVVKRPTSELERHLLHFFLYFNTIVNH